MKHDPNHRLAHALKYAAKQAELSTGYVYFVQCNEFTKIGFSSDVTIRLWQMQIGNPYPLKLLKSIPSMTPEQLEQDLHGPLESYRVRGEWFKLPQEVLDSLLSSL